MPFVSKAQRRWAHTAAGKKALGGTARVAEWDNATSGSLPEHVKSKKKYKIAVNNKLKGALGAMNPKTNAVEINVKKHKGDKAELASTVKHELLHVKHPKMTEKEVYKKSAKTKIAPPERQKLLSLLKNKEINKTVGTLKRKLKIAKDVVVKPGDLFNKAKEQSKKRTAIMGLI